MKTNPEQEKSQRNTGNTKEQNNKYKLTDKTGLSQPQAHDHIQPPKLRSNLGSKEKHTRVKDRERDSQDDQEEGECTNHDKSVTKTFFPFNGHLKYYT